MKSAEGGMSSARQGCMESSRRDVCYQADEGGLDKKLSNPIGLLNFLSNQDVKTVFIKALFHLFFYRSAAFKHY